MPMQVAVKFLPESVPISSFKQHIGPNVKQDALQHALVNMSGNPPTTLG